MKEAISVLLPVCNESDVIQSVLEDWLREIERLPKGSTLEIEDANSTDGTLQILRDYKNKFPKIIYLYERPDRDGFTKAVRRLMANAKNNWMFVADSDGQYYARDIRQHLLRWDENIHFIKGVKVNRQDSFFRRFFSFLINRFIVMYFGFPFLDFNSSHYLISKKLYNEISPNKWFFKYSINIEITMRAMLSNFRYEYVYIHHSERKHGVSRGNPPIKFLGYGLQAFRDVLALKKEF